MPRFECLERRELLAADLVLTEFMASNSAALFDADGDAPDWVEIHNGGSQQVDLSGWTLTDHPGRLDKWEFPARTLAPDQYLVVFASGKDRRPETGELHTNFKLKADGEYAALVSPASTVVSEYGPDGADYPPQFTDVSYGIPAGGGAPGYLESPTPGAPNTAQRGPLVEFDRPSGVFRQPFALTLSVDAPGAVIHFTTDGSEPTEAAPVYTDPIPIAASTQIRAMALAPGMAASVPASAWYVTTDADLRGVTSNLPIVVLDNFGQGRPSSTNQLFNAMVIFEPDAATGRSSPFDTPTVAERSGIRQRGMSTKAWKKGSYSVEIWDHRNKDKAIPLLGMPADSDWALYSPYKMDHTLLHNALVYNLSNQVGLYAVRTRPVEVYYNMDGGNVSAADYRGVYYLMERIKRGPNRVNIQKLGPEDNQEPEISGGWILEHNRAQDFTGGGQITIAYLDPKREDVTPAQAAWIKNYLDQMGESLSNPDPETGYPHYIDVNSWIDYHILDVMTASVDALRLSTYFYKDRGGKIKFGPLWDFDRSLESADPRDDNPHASLMFGHNVEYVWWGILFEDADFKQRWIDRWFELRRTVLSDTNILSTIDSIAGKIAEAQARNFDRWIDYPPRSVAPDAFNVGLLDGTWEGELAHMKAWFLERLHWTDSQFPTPPTLTPDASRVELGREIRLTGTAGPIYYTTDGNDPRLPGGEVRPDALVADGQTSLTFAEPVSIVARVLVDGQWSAPAQMQYRLVGAPDDARPLTITEMNYHPVDPTAAELVDHPTWTDQDFEFLELANAGEHPIDLTGVTLAGGVEFTFAGSATVTTLAPGAEVLVVADRAAFETRYGTGLPVAGEFTSGNLSNGGEQIQLADRYGNVLERFAYGDSDPWPERADGLGSTLELIDRHGDPADPTNWRASSRYGGTPGMADTGPVEDVLINEVRARGTGADPDLVELHNTTSQPVDVGGWYLSHDGSDLLQAKIPEGTTVPAGGYQVLDVTQLGLDLNGVLGDELWLVDVDPAGQPIRFVDQVRFDATDAGVALGRWPAGAPAGVLLPMAAPSFGAANPGLRTGAAVISEVDYHPPRPAPIVATDFAAGTGPDFAPVQGDWIVRDGGLEVTPGAEQDTIATIGTGRPVPTNFVLSTTLKILAAPDFQHNAAILFDYHGPTDFKFVALFARAGKWRIGQRDATGWHYLAETVMPISLDKDIFVRVEVRGSSVLLRSPVTSDVQPNLRLDYDFGTPLNDGQVGIGSKNGTPRFEQIKLEWLGDPLDLEFVELVGTGDMPVDLGGWRLEDGVVMTFPTGTMLPADAPLVVVDFDPADPERAATFRDWFGIDESVVLAGPYGGRLDDGGGVVRLVQPVAPAPGQGDPGLAYVDQMVYDSRTPWPTAAAGHGRALARAAAEAPGYLGASWSALVPTPGTVRFAVSGDLNFDGHVDGQDVGPFVHVVADPEAYSAQYGKPAMETADTDGDGDVDFDDIDDFVALFSPTTTASGARAGGPATRVPTLSPNRREPTLARVANRVRIRRTTPGIAYRPAARRGLDQVVAGRRRARAMARDVPDRTAVAALPADRRDHDGQSWNDQVELAFTTPSAWWTRSTR